jgi:hypothetical protein
MGPERAEKSLRFCCNFLLMLPSTKHSLHVTLLQHAKHAWRTLGSSGPSSFYRTLLVSTVESPLLATSHITLDVYMHVCSVNMYGDLLYARCDDIVKHINQDFLS